ncbi:MAG: hypothetical protein NXH72_02840 [Hyphomonadaceae bacterium]|nr:hypothetical protein [Hyphomonadaceae bacterium]
MKWLVCLLLGAVISVSAQAQDCDKSETACVLDAAWTAALVLPEEKRTRLAAPFLELALLTDDEALISFWEARFEQSRDIVSTYPDYGWQTAKPLLEAEGVDGLIARAEQRAAPLSFGRTDVLLAAGKHYRISEPDKALRLNRAMLQMMRSASKFERPNLAHAAAELAMARCDAGALSEAMAATDAPDNLRYAFWRARIDGKGQALLPRVRAIDTEDDTREVRRVLDGYRAILEYGYCPARKSEIGG